MDKFCTKCKELKSLSEFRKQSRTKDGHKYVCKPCDSAAARDRYSDKEKSYIKLVKEWQFNNRNKVKDYKKKYYRKVSERKKEKTSLKTVGKSLALMYVRVYIY